MEIYLDYARGLNAREEVFLWIKKVLRNKLAKKKINQSEVEHVLDYLIHGPSPKRLLKMSYEEARSNTDKWVKAEQKKGKDIVEDNDDVEIFHEFKDGSKILKLLSKKSYQREGHLMSHCLGGYSPNSNQVIYSYRDSKNMPHATFEVQENNNEVAQIKGKGNGPIHPKYIHPVLIFLELLGQEIRPRDMQNLGYYHIHEDLVWFAKNICPKEEITEINGEFYATKTP